MKYRSAINSSIKFAWIYLPYGVIGLSSRLQHPVIEMRLLMKSAQCKTTQNAIA